MAQELILLDIRIISYKPIIDAMSSLPFWDFFNFA